MRMNRLLALVAIMALVLGSGCGDGGSERPAPPSKPMPTPTPEPAAPTPPTPPAAATEPAPATPDAERGSTQYAAFCASCHGATGDGDGPLAGSLSPKPAKHSDPEVMNPLDDDYLFRVIKEGGAAVGKSPLMAPWGGTLSDAQIRDLVAHIRTLTKEG